MADPYAILGVARGASEDEIKKAYRKLAKELHPDRNRDNPKAAERFGQVTNAYDLLSDKDKRARFDRGEIDGDGNPTAPFGFGRGGPGAGGQPGGFRPDFGSDGGDFSDIFEGLFGGGAAKGGGFASGFGRRSAPKGANVAYRVAVPFVDAVTLAPQRLTLPDGSTIEVKLPAGVESGTQMRLAGKGQPGPGGSGDAIVTIEVQPHAFYTRDGDDVRLDLPVSLAEAVLGAEVRVPTPDGAVMLKVPKGSSSGKTLRVRGRGFHKKGGGGRGDLYVTLMVDLPTPDDALVEFVERWDGGRKGNPRGRLGV
ncbi:DnaJ C-terminal domain-containing protein [Sphingomonas spermidinifaciens]|uniref:DnaJ C-terminal domain-containing protein n=1 Tax=Sphingomonas spermidinifaciens TaxID=1141889 RepID=UPI001596885A|nr:J domain-containing protein [Sphingomonas spermidinifaciens]